MKTLDIAKEIQSKLESKLTLREIDDVIKKYNDFMIHEMLIHRDYAITNFGSFKVVDRKPRVGFDIQRRKKMKIHGFKTVSFKIAKNLKNALNV